MYKGGFYKLGLGIQGSYLNQILGKNKLGYAALV